MSVGMESGEMIYKDSNNNEMKVLEEDEDESIQELLSEKLNEEQKQTTLLPLLQKEPSK
jgi:hypothetical protein